jgi:hypothetical protein
VWEQCDEIWDVIWPIGFEEDFFREVKVVRSKSKGRREILNWVSSINYGHVSASTRYRKGKSHVQ